MLTQQPSRPICLHCRTSLAKPNGVSKHGFKKWHRYCVDCSKSLYDPDKSYLLNKKLSCEECGFEAKDKCQLDLVFKDGNKANKKSANLKTLCANCARLFKKKLRAEKKSIFNNLTVDADIRI